MNARLKAQGGDSPSFDRVIAALEAHGRLPAHLDGRPNGYLRLMVHCPAHKDREPSLSVVHAGDRALVHCFAGCQADDVIEALGLSWPDLFDDDPRTAGDGAYFRASDSGDSGHTLGEDRNTRNAEDLLIDMRAAIEAASEGFVYPLHPIAARGFLTILAGRHSARKTWLMLLAGLAVHRGDAGIAGLACTQTPVLYVDAENGPHLMGKRFRDAGIPADGLLVADGTQLVLPKGLGLLDALIGYTKAGLVVLDSLRRLTPGKRENESDDMAPIVGAIANLARKHNAAIVLIHHRSSKDGAANTRGSSSIEDQADLVFALDRKSGVSVLRPVKFRIDAEPDDLWLRFDTTYDLAAGTARMLLERAAPQASGEDGSWARPPSVPDQLMRRIRAVAGQVRQDGSWTPKHLAAVVDRKPDDASFKRAIAALVESDEWVAEGTTRSRRYRPADAKLDDGSES